MKTYNVEFGCGQTLVKANSAEAAAEWASREFGRTNGPYDAKEATESDIAWVRGMGGATHEAN